MKYDVSLTGFDCDYPGCPVSVIVTNGLPPDGWFTLPDDGRRFHFCSEEHAREGATQRVTVRLYPSRHGVLLRDLLA